MALSLSRRISSIALDSARKKRVILSGLELVNSFVDATIVEGISGSDSRVSKSTGYPSFSICTRCPGVSGTACTLPVFSAAILAAGPPSIFSTGKIPIFDQAVAAERLDHGKFSHAADAGNADGLASQI